MTGSLQTIPDGSHVRWKLAVIPVVLATLLAVLDYQVANIALPTIAHDMDISSSRSVWVVNAYQLVNCMLLIPLAAWSERVGSARLCKIGLWVIILGSIVCAEAHSFLMLVLARALQGVGGACIMSVSAALIRTIYPIDKIGRGLALGALTAASGTALAPPFSSAILAIASWRWLFWFNLPFGAVILILTALFLPATPGRPRPFDASSLVLNLAGFGFLVVGSDMLVHGEGIKYCLLLVMGGVLALFMLVRRQSGKLNPMFPVDLLSIRDFRVAFLVCFIGFLASNFFQIAVPFLLAGPFHRDAVSIGLTISPWPVAMVVAGLIVGRLADRYSAAILSSLGLFVLGVGFLLVRITPMDAHALQLMWRFAIAGLGFGFFVAPNNKAMMIAAPKDRSGSASGMVSIGRILGQTVGAMCVAMILARVKHSPTLLCLEWATAIAWLAGVLSLSRLFLRGDAPSQDSLSGASSRRARQ